MTYKSKNYRQLKEISTATLLEEAVHLKLIFKGVIFIALLVAAFIVWACFINIKETAVTFGEIIPQGQVQVVQHLEGGIVTKVLVNNGMQVHQGQLLITMDPTGTLAELNQLRGREISLILDSRRLNAYLNGQKADLVEWGKQVIHSKYNTVKNRAEITRLLSDEKSLLALQNKKRLDQKSVLLSQIERRQQKLKEVIEQKKVWHKHIKLLTEEFEMYRKLRKNNLIAHKDYLTILREMNRAKGELARLSSEILQNEQGIQEGKNKLQELLSNLQEKASESLSEVNTSLLEVRHKIEKLEDKMARMKIKAPVTGVVKGLRVFAGNVVQPGGLLLEIVPYDQDLIIESRINPRDIGYIKIGDEVNVKVLTYDYARYGSLKGKLIKISASTFNDAKQKPYYKATIELVHQYLGSKHRPKLLKPGMTVEASIITGEKTLMQYLLKPIYMSANSAFRER